MNVHVASDKSLLPMPSASLSLTPGYGPVLGNRTDKDGGATVTVAAVIAALGAMAKLMTDISGNTSDLEKLIRTMSRNIQDIRDTVARIERFIERLPLLIDRTVEAKFADYVGNQLRALMLMYLEIKAGLIGAGTNPIPAEVRNRLAYVHDNISKESRAIMGYGTPAASVVALTISIEDDCARLLNMPVDFRRAAIKTLADFFTRVLTGHAQPPTADSIEGNLQSQTALLTSLDGYVVSYLDTSFLQSTRAWSSPWRCRTGGTKNDHWRTCNRENYEAAVIGNSTARYSYRETSSPETTTEPIGSSTRLTPKLAPESHAVDEYSVIDTALFRKDLTAQPSDIAYANLVLDSRVDLVLAKADIEKLKVVFATALATAETQLAGL